MFLVKCRKDVLKLRTGTLHLIKIAANSNRRTRQEAAQKNLFCWGLLWCNYKGMRCVLCGPFSRWNLVVNTLCQTEMKKYKNTKNVGMLHQIYIKTPEGMNETVSEEKTGFAYALKPIYQSLLPLKPNNLNGLNLKIEITNLKKSKADNAQIHLVAGVWPCGSRCNLEIPRQYNASSRQEFSSSSSLCNNICCYL